MSSLSAPETGEETRLVGRGANTGRSARQRRTSVITGVLGQQLGLVVVIVLLGVIASVKNPVFISGDNVSEVFLSSAVYFIAACPSALVIIGGGLDISVGSAIPVGGVVAGTLMARGMAWGPACLLALIAGLLLGLVNGLIIRFLRVPPFIATLGMFFFAGGLATATTAGKVYYQFPHAFSVIGQGSVFAVPYPVLIAVAVGIVFHVILEHTPFGYDTRAIGGNELAATANGVRVGRTKIFLYVVSGLVSAGAGILLAARLGAASSDVGGAGFTFQIITAIIIGGTSLFGGEGRIVGTALGALLFSVIDSALAITRIPTLYENVAVGVILVIAVAIDQSRRSREFRVR